MLMFVLTVDSGLDLAGMTILIEINDKLIFLFLLQIINQVKSDDISTYQELSGQVSLTIY